MPVSHIGLTVSHLPTSCSFFLSALQPLGYRYIGQQGSQIGLGIHDADFFLCQETPGVKAGAAHIAFTAPSRTAVRDFYTAALTAGGRPNGSPACRADDGHFNAAVLDLDGNSIEVVFRDGPDVRDDGTVVHHSRVITWERTVSETFYHDDRSVVSGRSAQSASKQADAPPPASKAPSVVSTASKPPSVARSVSEPALPAQAPPATKPSGDSTAKTIVGTLIGAAAGAAVAYAMVSSERDSAKKEAEFNVLKQAKNMVSQLTQTKDQPQPPMPDPQVIHETQPKALPAPHRNISDTESHYSSTQRSVHAPRAIEPAPSDYHDASYSLAPPRSEAPRVADYAQPTYSIAPSRAQSVAHRSRAPSEYERPKAIEYVPAQSIAPSRVSSSSSHRSSRTSTEYERPKAIEYIPAASIAPSRSNFSAYRSNTSPELLTIEKARSTVSRAHSAAPSSFISSFVPDHVDRDSEGSVASKAKSSHSRASKHSSHSKARSSSRSRAPSPPPSKPASRVASKAASLVGSILGRDAKSQASKHESDSESDFIDDLEVDGFNDTDTVAPSDSISNAGSRRSHRSHRSHRSSKHHHHGHGSSADSSVTKHSSSSSHHSRSSKSHHSSSSHRRHRSPTSSVDGGSTHSKRLPTVISEPSDASTVKPIRKGSASSAVSKASTAIRTTSHRKDSVTQASSSSGEDDRHSAFKKDRVVYGDGDVPVRGITQSMVDGLAEKHKGNSKSMMSFALGQKLRAFEGGA